jgi:hypothetical protein
MSAIICFKTQKGKANDYQIFEGRKSNSPYESTPAIIIILKDFFFLYRKFLDDDSGQILIFFNPKLILISPNIV